MCVSARQRALLNGTGGSASGWPCDAAARPAHRRTEPAKSCEVRARTDREFDRHRAKVNQTGPSEGCEIWHGGPCPSSRLAAHDEAECSLRSGCRANSARRATRFVLRKKRKRRDLPTERTRLSTGVRRVFGFEKQLHNVATEGVDSRDPEVRGMVRDAPVLPRSPFCARSAGAICASSVPLSARRRMRCRLLLAADPVIACPSCKF